MYIITIDTCYPNILQHFVWTIDLDYVSYFQIHLYWCVLNNAFSFVFVITVKGKVVSKLGKILDLTKESYVCFLL